MRTRSLVSVISLTFVAPAALANPARSEAPPAAQPPPAVVGSRMAPELLELAPIDLTVIPGPCRPLTKQASAADLAVAYSTRIALASCMAERAVAPLALCDCGASVVAIDAAVAPAIALLDDVIASAEPTLQAVAEDTEGQLYAGFAIRMRGTVPAVGPNASAAEVMLRDMRAQTLEAQLAPWHEAAMASFEHVVELAKAHPEITRNAAAATAVQDAERRVAADVATR